MVRFTKLSDLQEKNQVEQFVEFSTNVDKTLLVCGKLVDLLTLC